MTSDAALNNRREASAFDQDFGQYVQQARRDNAVDFMEGLANTAPVAEPAAPQGATPIEDQGDFETSLARDVSVGVITAPRSAVRGATKGLNSMLGFLRDVMDYTPDITFRDDSGTVDYKPRLTTRGDSLERLEKGTGADFTGAPQLPVIDKPPVETVTGDVIENIAQFAVGLKGVDKLGKGVKFLNDGKLAGNITKGALADLLAFDEHEARLSNVIEQVPALQNPVTEYLAADEDDSFAEGKLKQAIEGMTLGGLTDIFFKGIKLLKKGKKARMGFDADGHTADDLFGDAAAEAADEGVNAKNFEFLGNADADDLFIRRQKKMDDAAVEVQQAFGKPKAVKAGENKVIDDYEINFARIEAPDDIKQLMDDMVNRPELKESIEAERRGVRDARTTLTAATDIDGFDQLMERRTGDAFNAETIIAARKVYYDTTSKLMDAAKAAASPEASAIDQFNFRKMVAVHHAVQKEFMGVRAEAGRALQAWNIPVGGQGAENARALDQVLNEFGGIEASKDLARRLVHAGNNLNTSQINAITQKAAGARTLDAVAEAWTLGLLTNPTTHVVNISSNALTGLYLGGERLWQAFLKDSPVTLREGAEYFTALLETQKLAFKNGAEAFRTGQTGIGMSKLDLPRVRNTARDILDPDGRAGIFSKAMDAWGAVLSKAAGGSLAFGDEYQKTVLYQAQLRALAVRQGVADGLEGDALQRHVAAVLADPPAVMRADAVQFANYGTFTKELGKTGQALQRVISNQPWLRFVVPFVRTPVNIFKFTFDRTPLTALSRNFRDDIAAGGIRRSTAQAKIGMGTTVMAIGADMAMNGQITGAGPIDPELRAGLRRSGWQPYSIKIGDKYYSYSRFEPVATILGMSADMAEILSNYEAYDIEDQSTIDSLATAVVIAVSNQVVGKTFLSGFADTAQMLADPGRYGQAYLQRFAASFVPAGAAAVERAVNPEMEYVFNTMDAFKARIPGVSADVPKRRNIWGEEIAYFTPHEDAVLGAPERILSLFNPVYYSAEKAAPVDRWMLKNGFSISMPNKQQVFDGVKINLRNHPAAYSRLVELRGSGVTPQKYSGQTMKQFFDALADESEPLGRHVTFFRDFGNDFDDQQNFISSVVSDYQAAAKEQLREEFPEIETEIAQGRLRAEKLNSARPAPSRPEGR